MKVKTSLMLIFFVCMAVLLTQSCQKEEDPAVLPPDNPVSGTPVLPATPYNYAGSLANMPAYLSGILASHPDFDNTPADNPITNDGATLGRVLFYDKSLSANNTISCGSCHHQDKAFVDGVQFSTGFEGRFTRRNSMPLSNLRFVRMKKMFWDTRAANLEEQVLKPIQDHIEMGIPSLTALENKLKTRSYYPALFQKAFGTTAITSDRISKALAQFLRSIVSFNSRFDAGLANGFSNFTPQELNGMNRVQATCGECHNDFATFMPGTMPTFFFNTANIPVTDGLDLVSADNGLGEITGDPQHNAAFKVPSLRNVELTAPYMHDGRFTTLEQVLTHYESGIKNVPNLPVQLISPGIISGGAAEKADMIAFLKTLTDRTVTTDVKYSDPFK